MAATIFLISCDTSSIENNLKQDNLSERSTTPPVKELTDVCYNYISENPGYTSSELLTFLNDYIVNHYGREYSFDVQSSVAILENAKFQSEGNSLEMYFRILYGKNHISENEMNYFLEIDNDLKDIGDARTAVPILNSYSNQIENDDNLNKNEKAKLNTFCANMVFLYETYDGGELVSRDLCTQCMYDHRWEIMAVSALAVAAWIGCMISSWGFGAAGCTALAAAIIAAGTAAIMETECYEECFGEHCGNPECPPDMPATRLGNFCCYETELSNPAVWKGGYYYDPVEGDCNYGLAIPVGDVCYYGPVPEGYGEGVIIDNKLCVMSHCPE